MTDPIKGCPQPDPPELVMRADGYHYQENEMKESQMIQAFDKWAREECINSFHLGHCWDAWQAALALNAPADREVTSEALEGWKWVPIKPTEEMKHAGYAARKDLAQSIYEDMFAATPAPPVEQPIDMVLYCPKCGAQHIDAPETTWKEALEATGRPVPPEAEAAHAKKWNNPPHRSHLCADCGHIWRHADVPTNGVAAVKTKGKDDSPPAEQQGTEAPPKMQSSPFESYVAQLLHAAWIDGWASCRDAEFVGDEAMNEAFNQCVTLITCMSIEQASPAEQPGEWEPCVRRVTISEEPIDWLKKHYPALCEKSGLCERVAGRLYTKVFLEQKHPAPSLAELLAKVEALPNHSIGVMCKLSLVNKADVLAEIDKLGGGE